MIVEHGLAGFVRIATNPRIYDAPAPTALALEFVRRIRVARNATPISANSATWELLGEWVDEDDRIVANLVPDAFLATLATSHGARSAMARTRVPGSAASGRRCVPR